MDKHLFAFNVVLVPQYPSRIDMLIAVSCLLLLWLLALGLMIAFVLLAIGYFDRARKGEEHEVFFSSPIRTFPRYQMRPSDTLEDIARTELALSPQARQEAARHIPCNDFTPEFSGDDSLFFDPR